MRCLKGNQRRTDIAIVGVVLLLALLMVVIALVGHQTALPSQAMTLRHMMLEKGGQSEWAENRKGQCYQSASQAKRGSVFLLISTAHGCPTSYGEVSQAIGTGTVQATPTMDPTVVAALTAKENLRKLELENDRSFTAWFWNSSLGSTVAALLAVGGVLLTAVINFRQWKKTQTDAQDKDLKDKAEERFKTAVTALGDEKEGVQIGGASLLQSFLNKDDEKIYGRYYTQIFDLAVAYLRLPRTSNPPEDPDGIPCLPEDSNAPLPLTTLRESLIVVFKKAFPLARDLKRTPNSEEKSSQSLDATEDITKSRSDLNAMGIKLDRAYLWKADLKRAHMPRTFLRLADLRNVSLKYANLSKAKLIGADLRHAHLENAFLREADLSKANLTGAYLRNADLTAVDFTGAKLDGADLHEAKFDERDEGRGYSRKANLKDALLLTGTDLRGVEGLTKDQLKALRDQKGAIIDGDDTIPNVV